MDLSKNMHEWTLAEWEAYNQLPLRGRSRKAWDMTFRHGRAYDRPRTSIFLLVSWLHWGMRDAWKTT